MKIQNSFPVIVSRFIKKEFENSYGLDVFFLEDSASCDKDGISVIDIDEKIKNGINDESIYLLGETIINKRNKNKEDYENRFRIIGRYDLKVEDIKKISYEDEKSKNLIYLEIVQSGHKKHYEIKPKNENIKNSRITASKLLKISKKYSR